MIALDRFDEASVGAKNALRLNPFYFGAYRCLASAFAHLGRDAEAREAATRLLEFDPAFTISEWIARGGQSNSRLLIEGFRKGGARMSPACPLVPCGKHAAPVNLGGGALL